jgi:hypothetical protein
MNILGIEIPDAVIKSARAERLVVFVGAGASYAPPANLPGFKELTERIAEGTDAQRVIVEDDGARTEEPFDRFLGRLEKNDNVNVHQRAYEILKPSESSPNAIHHSIIQLFPQDATLRIVTTNFDMHLEGALKEQHRQGIPVYQAPALPLGSDFDGIVYVHGRLEPKPEQMVLTDRDFGKAYLTDGHARRFLRQLFATFDVLFVGYSHSDPVVSYLARGLPPESERKRFALTEAGANKEHWRLLDIEAIEYPNLDGVHARFGELLEELGHFLSRGAASHEQVMKQYMRAVTDDPEIGIRNLNAEGRDYLLFLLSDQQLRRLFFDHAKELVWLRWMDEVEQLQSLLDPLCNDTDLIYWFVRDLLQDRGEGALRILSRSSNRLFSRSLQIAIAQELAHEMKSRSEAEDSSEVSKEDVRCIMHWVAFIASNPQIDPTAARFLGYMMRDLPCTTVTRTLHLYFFEIISRPYLDIRARVFGDRQEEIEENIGHVVDHHTLKEAWEQVLRPNLELLAEPLISVLTQQFHTARWISQNLGQATQRIELLSYHRSAIEPHGQDLHHEVMDVLIDSARDSLQYFNEHHPKKARALIESWIGADPLLLRRLAVYGMPGNTRLSANQKFTLIADTPGMLRDLYAHHELQHTLRHCYAEGKEPLRRRILRKQKQALVERYHPSRRSEEEPERLAIWTRQSWLDFLVWLQAEVVDCTLLEEAIQTVQAEDPNIEPETAHHDFKMWSRSEWVKSVSPISEEELVALSPAEVRELEVEIAERPSAFDVNEVQGLHETITKLVSTDFGWGLKLAEHLIGKDQLEAKMWSALFKAWQEGSYPNEQQVVLIRFLTDHETVREIHKIDVAHFLSERYQSGGSEVSQEVLGQATQLAVITWPVLDSAYRVTLSGRDLFTEVLNNPLGRLGRFAVSVLSRQKNDFSTSLDEVPSLLELFNNIADDADDGDRVLGAVALAWQLPFLSAIASDWTSERLIPLLDWERNVETARALWSGYFRSYLRFPMTESFQRYFAQSLEHIDHFEERTREKIPKYLIAYLLSEEDALTSEWFRSFLLASTDEDRALFWNELRYGGEEQQQEENFFDMTWETWGKRLFQQRVTGGPDLGNSEWNAIVQLGPHLDRCFPEFVNLMEQRQQIPCYEHTPDVFFRLTSDDPSKSLGHLWNHPEPLARYLLYFLAGEIERYWCSELREILRKLRASGLTNQRLLDRLKDRYVEKCGSADDLWDEDE